MLEKIVESHPKSDTCIYVMYDIACTLKKHLMFVEEHFISSLARVTIMKLI